MSEWIKTEDKLPEKFQEVIVTCVNHNPQSYYQDIKDVPQTGFAVWYEGWYWWTATAVDLLNEYGQKILPEINKAIEITAWMPLPDPYKRED